MLNGLASEYTPLQGSAPQFGASKKTLVTASALVSALCFFALMFSSSSSTAQLAHLHSQNTMAAAVPPPAVAVEVPAAEAIEAQQAVVEAQEDAAVSKNFLNVAQYDGIYNIFSFAIASMGSATVFFFFQFFLVDKEYRTALVITSLVTLIAFYHYFRIFNSFTASFISVNGEVTATGVPFNDAYRYVDWLLTVPLLLTELILVMNFDEPNRSRNLCFQLGGAAAAMIILGYPGEISSSSGTRWTFWALAMIPFLFIVYTLLIGLSGSIAKQVAEVQPLIKLACWVTVISWCTYPIVFMFPMFGLDGADAFAAVQVGYSIADIIAKPITGLLVWKIASVKSA